MSSSPVNFRAEALLLGLNYAAVPGASLSGCINDVNDVAAFLKKHAGFKDNEIRVLDDVRAYQELTYTGMIRNLYNLAMRSWTERLNFVWIHYSGHGTSVTDSNRDESDGRDEAIVPVDFRRMGVIRDDTINSLLGMFNPITRVFIVFDACHSGTMADLRFHYSVPDRTAKLESSAQLKSNLRVCMLSGCRDNQTSADAHFADGAGRLRASGALTYCMLKVIATNPEKYMKSLFDLASDTRAALASGRFGQVPELSSSFDLVANPTEAYVIPDALRSRGLPGGTPTGAVAGTAPAVRGIVWGTTSGPHPQRTMASRTGTFSFRGTASFKTRTWRRQPLPLIT